MRPSGVGQGHNEEPRGRVVAPVSSSPVDDVERYQRIHANGIGAESRCGFPLLRLEATHPDTCNTLVLSINHISLGAGTVAANYTEHWVVQT